MHGFFLYIHAFTVILFQSSFSFRYSVDINFEKNVVNKDIFRDPALKRKARREVKAKFEERYLHLFILLLIREYSCYTAHKKKKLPATKLTSSWVVQFWDTVLPVKPARQSKSFQQLWQMLGLPACGHVPIPILQAVVECAKTHSLTRWKWRVCTMQLWLLTFVDHGAATLDHHHMAPWPQTQMVYQWRLMMALYIRDPALSRLNHLPTLCDGTARV